MGWYLWNVRMNSILWFYLCLILLHTQPNVTYIDQGVNSSMLGLLRQEALHLHMKKTHVFSTNWAVRRCRRWSDIPIGNHRWLAGILPAHYIYRSELFVICLAQWNKSVNQAYIYKLHKSGYRLCATRTVMKEGNIGQDRGNKKKRRTRFTAPPPMPHLIIDNPSESVIHLWAGYCATV